MRLGNKMLHKLLISFFSFITIQTAHAWTVNSQIAIGPKGEFQDTVTLSCRPDETLCQQVCQAKDSCWKEQELCFNCLGTANPILRTVFTEINRLYRNSKKVVPTAEIEKVFQKEHVFISARSIYNFYSAVDNADVLARFQSLCPTSSTQPLVVLGKNLNNEPVQIKYIICEGIGQYNQGMYVLEYSPQTQVGITNLTTKP